MILVDANLLVYAHVSNFAEHETAKRWLDTKLTGPGRVGLPWDNLLAFVRLVSNPRVFEQPEPIDQAWEQVRNWLQAPTAWIPQATERHAEILDTLIPHCSRSRRCARFLTVMRTVHFRIDSAAGRVHAARHV